MDLLLSDPFYYLDVFLLLFTRVISLFIAVPVFSNSNIPNIAKISLALFISTILINVVDIDIYVSSAYPLAFGWYILKEVFIGWIIGFSVYIAFTVVMLAGQFIDQQIGFAMVNVFDPLSQIQLSITGNLYYYLLLLILVIRFRHHSFITVIVKSYDYLPIGTFNVTQNTYDVFLGFYKELFILALQIAAPFFLAMLVTNVILGILARTAPQLNLFVIGFPLKLIFGLTVLYITIGIFDTVSEVLFDKMEDFMDGIIKALMVI